MSMDETDEHTTDVTREWCEANAGRYDETWVAIQRCGSVNASRMSRPPDGLTREQCIALWSYVVDVAVGLGKWRAAALLTYAAGDGPIVSHGYYDDLDSRGLLESGSVTEFGYAVLRVVPGCVYA